MLVGGALTAWSEVRAGLRLAGAARQVGTDLGHARLLAVAHQRDVRLVATSGAAGYRIEEATPDGWRALRVAQLPPPTRVVATTAPGGIFRFTPRGSAAAFGTIVVQGDAGTTRRIVVNIAGRVRISG